MFQTLAPNVTTRHMSAKPRPSSSAGRAVRKSSLVAVFVGLALALSAAGTASAVSYQGYSGDFNGGFLTCLSGLGVVGTTNPPAINIASENPSMFGEDQHVWTTSMLFAWDGTKWAPVSGWTNWRYTDYNEVLDPALSSWQEWTGSAWIQESDPPSWTGLAPGYYTVATWMYFGARPGIVGAGWAYSWPTPLSASSSNYCQI
jgi:hypothetical protein